MRNEQTDCEKELEAANLALVVIWEEIERVDFVRSPKVVEDGLRRLRNAFRARQIERHALASLPYVLPEIGQ